MSDPISPLNGASASGIAQLREAGLTGMITLRGDLADGTLAGAVKILSGHSVPSAGQGHISDTHGVFWMSPDELLILCPYAGVTDHVHRLGVALEGAHHLVANVSDARALFELSGPRAREVLAKLVPVDLAPGQFGPGMFRRTRMAQIPAAFWMTGPETFRIVTFRSVAQYAFDVLRTAAMPGSEVDAF
ncbi:MAG: sarcosine oxidase subunit gamma family protein [Pseudomonadota bacterium]